MGHTQPPLEIGYNGTGSVNHDPFEIEIYETVPVTVKKDCSVKFKKHDVFKVDKDYRGGDTDEWIPLVKKNNTVKYKICPYKGDCPPWNVENTYSIKIGSGRTNKSKRKSKRKRKTESKRKSSSRRRK
jgi:hypothetical protein